MLAVWPHLGVVVDCVERLEDMSTMSDARIPEELERIHRMLEDLGGDTTNLRVGFAGGGVKSRCLLDGEQKDHCQVIAGNIYSFYTQVRGMNKTKELKRENFDVSPEQQAEIETLQALIEAPSKKDAMLLAVHLALHLASEARKGNQLFVGDPARHDLTRLVMLGIEKPSIPRWLYLVEQAHPWKKQLFIKGRKLPAAAVWTTMIANKLNVDEAADNWDLPVEAVHEILEYCNNNKALLQMEANEELRRLEEKGIGVVAKTARR